MHFHHFPPPLFREKVIFASPHLHKFSTIGARSRQSRPVISAIPRAEED